MMRWILVFTVFVGCSAKSNRSTAAIPKGQFELRSEVLKGALGASLTSSISGQRALWIRGTSLGKKMVMEVVVKNPDGTTKRIPIGSSTQANPWTFDHLAYAAIESVPGKTGEAKRWLLVCKLYDDSGSGWRSTSTLLHKDLMPGGEIGSYHTVMMHPSSVLLPVSQAVPLLTLGLSGSAQAGQAAVQRTLVVQMRFE